jgi:hypothetical protein
MSIGLLFWLLMLLWILGSTYAGWRPSPGAYWPLGTSLLLFLILIALGWAVFGSPIKH